MPLSTTYTKVETDYLLQKLESELVSGLKGTLAISDTAPTTQGLYILSDVGTYTNLGGLVAENNKVNYAYFDGTTWSLIAVEMNAPTEKFVENRIFAGTIISDTNPERTGFALINDKTQQPKANYSISKKIPVKAGMQVKFEGVFNLNVANPDYSLFHVYDSNMQVVEVYSPIGNITTHTKTIANDGFIQYTYLTASSFKITLLNDSEKATPFNYELIADRNSLTKLEGVQFDGTLDTSSSYKSTDYLAVKPNSEIVYKGYLNLAISVALYDANKRFIKSVIHTDYANAPKLYGKFTTTPDTAFIRATAPSLSATSNYAYEFQVFYVDKDISNEFPSVWQGYKSGADFKLTNGIEFKKQKAILDEWEDVIEMNSSKRLHQNFLITNRNWSILQNKASFLEKKAVGKVHPVFGYEKAGDVVTISHSQDGGNTYTTLFTITDSKINYVEPESIFTDGAIYYIPARVKPANYAYAEEILYRAEKINGIWDVKEVLKLPYYGDGFYNTFSVRWGASIYKNIVVINDYGSQGKAGKLWISQDYGNTFTKVLDIYQAPHTSYLSGGHIHGSAYDYVFERIWVSTGDGYTNTYVMWSDDFGATWSKVQVPYKDENGNSFPHTQFVGCLVSNDFVLFNHDSKRAGVYRYNRGKKSDVPLFEWVADITNHAINEMNVEGQYSGAHLIEHDGIFYAAESWHDVGVGNSGVLGKILVSKDGYNWDVFYQDTPNTATGRGYLFVNTVLAINEKNVMFKCEDGQWVFLNKPIFK